MVDLATNVLDLALSLHTYFNHRTVWVGRDLNYYLLLPHPTMAGHLPLHQVVQSPLLIDNTEKRNFQFS